MRIIDEIRKKKKDVFSRRPVTVAFLGDSVTQGCFELVEKGDRIDVVYDGEAVYHNRFRELFEAVFPGVPLVIVNAGISGDNAVSGYRRLERDVLSYSPDLVVVCFALNDCQGREEGLAAYLGALEAIFADVRKSGAECIFMTPNGVPDNPCHSYRDGKRKEIADLLCVKENSEALDRYVKAAKERCACTGVPVCDCHAIWKAMTRTGTDVSDLLANEINHPIREWHRVFAYELFRTILCD